MGDDEEQGQVSVAEKGELFQVVGLLEREDKAHEAGQVEREGDEAVVGDERHEKVVALQQQTELLDEALAVQVVVGCD